VSDEAMQVISARLKMARNWVDQYGSLRDRVEVPDQVPDEIRRTLTEDDRRFLHAILDTLRSGPLTDEELQGAIFETARSVGLKERRAFTVLYRILISRKSGPRLGPFINLLGREWVAERIESVL